MTRWNAWIGFAALGVAACETRIAPGDGDGESEGDDSIPEGFQLIAAELGPAGAQDFSTLILTFSDPVAPVDGVAPTDFRISFASSFSYSYDGETVEQSAYYEPATKFGSYEPIELTAIANGLGANQISITLAPTIGYFICTSVANWFEASSPDFPIEGGLFPHYAPGATPVTNTEGVPLEAIGPEWVLSGDDPPYYGYELFIEEAGFPSLIPQIPIPCPT